MKYLLVIDMQEEYIGASKQKESYKKLELINNINQLITTYSKDKVVYITNRFFWENKNKEKKIVEGLHIVSNQIFEKRKGNAFSNKELLNFLKSQGTTEIEIVGVDGNHCVAASAIGARKYGFEVRIFEQCVGSKNLKKYLKTKQYLSENGIIFKVG